MGNILYTDIHGQSHIVVRKEEKPKAPKKQSHVSSKAKRNRALDRKDVKAGKRVVRRMWRKLL